MTKIEEEKSKNEEQNEKLNDHESELEEQKNKNEKQYEALNNHKERRSILEYEIEDHEKK
jgi:hypothetical protein